MLSTTVNKKSVQSSFGEVAYNITLTLVLTDTVGSGFTKDFTCDYRAGQNVSMIVNKIISDMQGAINLYKSEQAIFNNATLDTAIITIKNALTV